ncbi:hypothetical protein DS834_06710 [Lactobacillus bombicola]|uniref:Uncharacterized protein n=1 Tax=Lactobacillus bombicola TaxID=1505723 RepID=A0ABX9LTF8_9LACO|nr:hypothetical protein [Lactobacillus bombicola]RHW50335.1 hypothetical protein DS834_06710 [Lactobacillus bombicola]
MSRKKYNPQNGLTHLLTLREESYEIIAKQVFKNMPNVKKNKANLEFFTYRIKQLAKKGATPTPDEIIGLSIYFFGSSNNWAKLFFPDSDYVTTYSLMTINDLLDRYCTVDSFTDFMKNRNKFNINRGLFDKNVTIKTITMIVISYIIYDLRAINRSKKSTNIIDDYKFYQNNIRTHLKFLVTQTMSNEKALLKLQYSLKKDIDIDNLSPRTLALTIMRTLISLI